jgi:hypothetical protein
VPAPTPTEATSAPTHTATERPTVPTSPPGVTATGTASATATRTRTTSATATLAIDLVVAWRVMRLTMLGRATPDVPCTVYFEEYEWKALYAFVGKGLHAIPAHTPCLRDAQRLLAQLGGFLGRKGDGDPRVKSIWIGLQRLDDISDAWLMFGPGSPLQPNHPLACACPVSRNPRYG